MFETRERHTKFIFDRQKSFSFLVFDGGQYWSWQKIQTCTYKKLKTSDVTIIEIEIEIAIM